MRRAGAYPAIVEATTQRELLATMTRKVVIGLLFFRFARLLAITGAVEVW